MWISKKRLERERIKAQLESSLKHAEQEWEQRQHDDIQKLKKEVKKLKQQMRELY